MVIYRVILGVLLQKIYFNSQWQRRNTVFNLAVTNNCLVMLVIGLLICIGAMQYEVRTKGDARVPRWLGAAFCALAGGQFGKYLVDYWYEMGVAPATEWRGALWILAVVIGVFVIGGGAALASKTPGE